MSRRSRSLVDQQLSLIDRLERNEEDPERLDSLFRLDHLAARLRRNSANLLVLAGAQLARDQRDPVPLSTVINAAVSEVEDYRRVEIAGLPDCTLIGAAAGGVIHLFAELIDNALRYSPPTTPVRVSASRGGDGGVVVRIADSGLGMNDADRRIANMRLQAGGEVSPDNARHMGLFVVGRIAARHGIRVGLRGPAANEAGSGTTAEIYLPPTVLEGAAQRGGAAKRAGTGRLVAQRQTRRAAGAPETAEDRTRQARAGNTERLCRTGPPVTLLPRRNPGSSGITEVPAQPAEQQPRRHRRELPTPWWESGSRFPDHAGARAGAPAPAQTTRAASNTSAFFAARSRDAAKQAETRPPSPSPPPAQRRPSTSERPERPDSSGRRRRDLPADALRDAGRSARPGQQPGPGLAVGVGPRLDVGRRGRGQARRVAHRRPWAAGAHTRRPAGARRGQRNSFVRAGPARRGGRRVQRRISFRPRAAARGAARDPEAVRASFSSHFGGVRTGRSHARETSQGSDPQ